MTDEAKDERLPFGWQYPFESGRHRDITSAHARNVQREWMQGVEDRLESIEAVLRQPHHFDERPTRQALHKGGTDGENP